MSDRLSRQAVRWVERTLGPGTRVQSSSALVGGTATDVDRLALTARGHDVDVVLRRYPPGHKWARGLVERESAALTAIADWGLPAPRMLAADPTGAHAGTPALLMTAMPGQAQLRPRDVGDHVRQLATVLGRIHQVPATLDPTDPYGFDERADRTWIGDSALARAAVEAASTASCQQQRVFVHGDYQPLNVVWSDGRLSGVVDWTFAGIAPRGLDAGHCRLALTLLFDADTAERFRRCYESTAGLSLDPRVDIRALLILGPGGMAYARRFTADSWPAIAARIVDLLRAAVARLG